MNSAPSSGLTVITNGGSNAFVFEGNHTITAAFSISQNGTPLFSVSPSGISVGVSLNSISVQQLHYLVNITSDVQTQITNLLSTLTSDVDTLNNTINTNVQTLNNTINSNYNTLNAAKQDKGNYVSIDANNAITLADNVTFSTVTPTELTH